MTRRYFVIQCDRDSIAATVLEMACSKPPFGEVIVTEVEPAIFLASDNAHALAAAMASAMAKDGAQ